MTQHNARSARTHGLIVRLRHYLREHNITASRLHETLNRDYLHPSEAVAHSTVEKLAYGEGMLLGRPGGTISSELYAAVLEFLEDRAKPTKKAKKV